MVEGHATSENAVQQRNRPKARPSRGRGSAEDGSFGLGSAWMLARGRRAPLRAYLVAVLAGVTGPTYPPPRRAELTIERRSGKRRLDERSATVSTGGRCGRSRRRSDGADSPTRRTCPSTIGAGRTTWGLGRDPPVPPHPKQRDEPARTCATARSTPPFARRATTPRGSGGVSEHDGVSDQQLGMGRARRVSRRGRTWRRSSGVLVLAFGPKARDDRHGGKWEGRDLPAAPDDGPRADGSDLSMDRRRARAASVARCALTSWCRHQRSTRHGRSRRR